MRESRATVRWIGLFAGPLISFVLYGLLPDGFAGPEGEVVPFTGAGRATAAVGVWMAVWWMTEAIPVYATSLLPLVLFPLGGAADMREAAAPYAHPLIFLFLGGFILGLSMQRWGLHNRIAFFALRLVGTKASHIVAGFMAVTAVMSMWVSNTATTIIMLPIAASVLDLLESRTGGENREQQQAFGLALLLAIAYSASVGGVGTLIGTPPNLFLASFAESQLGIEISFVRWMGVGLPVVAVFLPLIWLLLTRILFPIKDLEVAGGDALTEELYASLGPPKFGEKVTFVVFCTTAALWVARPLLNDWPPLEGLTDTGIAVAAALVLFLVPVDRKRGVFVMDWETAVRLPWGLLLLFGGGLSLAAAVKANGVAELIGAQAGAMVGMPSLLILLAVVTTVIFLTELTSNTATTAALLPILAAVAPALGFAPLWLAAPAAIAASCAFMLPVATPPNAIVFGSGRVTVPDMARAGFSLNLIAIGVVTLAAYTVIAWVLAPSGG